MVDEFVNGSDIVKDLNKLMKEYFEFNCKFNKWQCDKKRSLTIFIMALNQDIIHKGFLTEYDITGSEGNIVVRAFHDFYSNCDCEFDSWWNTFMIFDNAKTSGLIKENKFGAYELTDKCKRLYEEFWHSNWFVDISKTVNLIRA